MVQTLLGGFINVQGDKNTSADKKKKKKTGLTYRLRYVNGSNFTRCYAEIISH